MATTQKGTLGLSNKLSTPAQTAFVLDDLKTGTLISIAQLCDDDCIVIFSKYDVQIVKDDQVIIKGQRMTNGLWSVPLTQNTTHQANAILRTDKPTYLHATLGSPATSTLLQAIRRTHLTTIPGLTTNLISKHLPDGSRPPRSRSEKHMLHQNLCASTTTTQAPRGRFNSNPRSQKPPTLCYAFQQRRSVQILFGSNRTLPDPFESRQSLPFRSVSS
jgi:hypothetical protein